MIVDKQFRLTRKNMIKALYKLAYEEAIEKKEKVPSLDAFVLQGAPHFLAADGQTEVPVDSFVITLPGESE